MSTTVDQRVVSMQFDNSHFERNVSNTMSTLDKLKQKLNLSGASKGLENINAAAGKVNMSGLANGVETVSMKFSALQVMGVTALTNITNQAVNAGKRIVSALTIDPIKTGFSEYETQINAVQTILANTQSKGTTLNDVNAALDELNEYADMTIYNFTEMTRNIGTFTAAGVDLDTSVNAIKGIANLAAVSGSTSQQASTAMYQLSQALASGTVKLMDWNSVVNAGMGGQVFQDALKETARAHGVAIDSMIEKEGSFRETLSSGWLSSEILTDTLQKFTLTTEGLKDTQIEANREMLRAKGYTEDQIDEIFKLGDTATQAATKVKTFTQLWDVLKEAAQSGWTQTWEIIIGDFEEAKGLLTPLSDFLTGAINKVSDWRNTLLEGAFGSKIKSLGEAIEKFTSPVKKTTEAVKNAIAPIKGITKSLEEHKAVIGSIINGEWGHGEKRWKALTEAGYDWVYAQNLVNEQLGSSKRRTSEYTEYLSKQNATQEKSTETKEESTEAEKELAKHEIKRLAKMAKLSDAELEALGYTKDQIKAFKELAEISHKLGIPIDELIEKADEINGRWLFIESFKNIGKSIVEIFKSIGAAWSDVFDPIQAEQIFDFLAGFHRVTAGIRDYIIGVTSGAGNMDKVRRTFAGIFAVVDALTTLLGGGFKIAFKFVEQLLGYFNLDILDVTAAIGDMLVGFNEWLESTLDFAPIIKKVGPFVEKLVTGIRNLFSAIKGSEAFKSFVSYLNGVKSGLGDLFAGIKGMDSFKNLVEVLKNAGGSIKDWIETLKSSKNLPADIISGLANGIREGAPEVWNAIVTLATELWAKFCEVLGIHSPSTVFMSIGKFIIAGLILGLIGSIPEVQDAVKSIFGKISEFVQGVMPNIQGGLGSIWEFVKTTFGNIVTFLQGIDWGTVFAIGLVAASLFVIKQVSDALQALAAPFEGFSNFMESLGDAVENVSNGISKKLKADAFKSIADAILVLALAFAAIAFTVKYAGADSVWAAIGILAGLVVAMGVLSAAIGKLGPADIKQLGVYVLSLASLSVSILILAAAMAVLASIDETAFGRAIGAVVLLGGMVVGLVAATKLSGTNIGDVGVTLLAVAAVILIMAYIMKIISDMSGGDIAKGIFVIALFGGIITGLIAATKMFDHYSDGVGKTLLEISAAILLLLFIAKLIAKTPWDVLGKGIVGIALFGGITAGLIAITKMANKDAANIGGTLLSMAAAIGILALSVRMLGSMKWEALGKGVVGVAALSLIIKLLVSTIKPLAKDQSMPKIAATLIAMSTAILILAGTSMILSMMSLEGLAKGITAVGILGAIMSMMIKSLKGAQNVMGSLIAMSAMIVILTMAVAALSLIPAEKLLPAAGALVGVMAAMALIMHSMKALKDIKGKTLLNLLAMVGVVAVLGAIVWGLSLIDNPDQAFKNAMSVTALMGAMTLMLVPLTLIGKLAGHTALKGVLALTAMVVPLAAFVAALYFMPELTVTEATLLKLVTVLTAMTLLLVPLTLIGALGGFTALLGVLALTAMVVPLAAFCLALNYLPDVTKATGNVILLTTLMTAMTLLLIPLTLIGFLSVGAFAGITALTAMVIPLAAFGIALALLPDITDSIGTLNILIGVMYTMTNLLYLLAPIGPMALIGVTALAALEAVMVSVGAFAAVVGALDFIGLGMFIDKGIPILEKLAHAVGSLLGNVISGFITASESGLSRLPEIGKHLSDFMTNCEGFISGVKTVDYKAVTGVSTLVSAMLGLTAAQFLNGIVSLIQWAPSFADLGNQLSQFVIAAYPFIRGAQMMDETAVNGVKCLVDTLLLFTEASLRDGIASMFGMKIDFQKFGEDLAVFGDCVVEFSNKLTEGKVNPEAVQAAANAGKIIIELCNNIPKEGGLLQGIFGTGDLGAFSTNITTFGSAIVSFSKTVDGNVNKSAVEAAKNAGEILAELQDKLPKANGLVQMFTGQNDLATFGDQIVQFGYDMRAFCQIVAGYVSEEAVTAAKNAGMIMVELQNALPDSGGVKGWLFGDNDLGSFGDNLRELGEGLADFSVTISGVGTTNVNNAADACIKLVNMAKGMSGVDFGGVESFADSLGNIGALSVQNFVRAFKNAATDAADAGRTLIMNTLKGVDSAKADFKNAGVNLVLELGTGISNSRSRARTFATTMIADVLFTIRDKYDSFKSAGKYLVEGFAKGIDENTWQAEAEARAMANAAEKAAKDALQVNSPSKVFIPLGKAIPEGLVKGMDAMSGVVTRSSEDMANTALNSTSGVLASISDAFNSDVNTQPTIRPVLDLSDVTSGASSIGGLFSDQLVGVSASASGISASMSMRQNGANNDVISAINALGRKLGTSTGNTYMINGLSYNDGDDVSEALKTIVGAVRRERRS